MNAIIGMENAGFTIIDAKNTSGDYGYAIGKNEHKSYVTWMYDNRDNRTVSFSQGHYFHMQPRCTRKDKSGSVCRLLSAARGYLRQHSQVRILRGDRI